MKRIIYCLIAAILVAGLVLGCAPSRAPAPSPSPAPAPAPTPAPTPAKPITLKAVTYLPKTIPFIKQYLHLFDRINERSKGELTIEYLGGPEVIGALEQASAVQKRVVDIAFFPPTFHKHLVPVAGGLIWTPRETPQQERQWGLYDFLQELHNKAGFFYLGPGCTQVMYLYTRKKIETPYDLAGQRIATAVLGVSMIKALGMSHYSIPGPEMYTSVQLGVVDGGLVSLSEMYTASLCEVAPYIIDHSFGHGFIISVINLDTWNSLPKHLRDLIMEVQLEREQKLMGEMLERDNEARKGLLAKGGKFIKFSASDAKWYSDTIYKTEWAAYTVDLVEKQRELLTRLEKLLAPYW